MNRFESITKPLTWFMALLLAALVVGCGGGSNDNDTAASSSAKAMTTYSIDGATGVINETLKTIAVTKPYGTNITAMVATFTSTGAKITVNDVAQTSGTTANNFTNPVAYKVTAANGTWATYTVIVTIAANTAKAITAYSLNGMTGTINEVAKTIAVTMPYGTDISALVATFTTTGVSVTISGVTQTSGETPNNFTTSKTYTVTAGDANTATYTVNVTVALNSAKAITAYSLDGMVGTISGIASPYAIAVTMPYGTDRTNLVATFTTTGASVTISGVTQTSGSTQNSFTPSNAYTVTAADSSTAIYNVTVTVALNSAKAITAYSLDGMAGTISGAASPYAIAVAVPSGTNIMSMVATFTTTGASVAIGGVAQTSGSTQNDFTTPKEYTVTAADSSTAIYNVTVTVASAGGPVVCTGAPNCVNLGTAANYVIFGNAGVTNVPTSATTGNVGTAAAAGTITGFALEADSTNVFSTSTQVTGKVYAVDYAAPTPSDVGTASTDMGNAYTAANNIVGGAACPGSGDFSGLSLAPGIYKCTTGVTIPTDVTLAGTGAATDVWVFQIAGTLTQSSGMKVLLTNGALPQNVFWAVAGSVSIETTAQMEGVILGQTDINVLAGATVNGRLLAQTLVNLAGGTNTVKQPIP